MPTGVHLRAVSLISWKCVVVLVLVPFPFHHLLTKTIYTVNALLILDWSFSIMSLFGRHVISKHTFIFLYSIQPFTSSRKHPDCFELLISVNFRVPTCQLSVWPPSTDDDLWWMNPHHTASLCCLYTPHRRSLRNRPHLSTLTMTFILTVCIGHCTRWWWFRCHRSWPPRCDSFGNPHRSRPLTWWALWTAPLVPHSCCIQRSIPKQIVIKCILCSEKNYEEASWGSIN